MTFNIGEVMAWVVLAFFGGYTLGQFIRDLKWMEIAIPIDEYPLYNKTIWIWNKRFYVIEYGDYARAVSVNREEAAGQREAARKAASNE
jgi:hypothetical protein